MGIKVSEFGKTSKGKIAHIYTLVNGKGMALEVTIMVQPWCQSLLRMQRAEAKMYCLDMMMCRIMSREPVILVQSSEETETGQKMHRS